MTDTELDTLVKQAMDRAIERLQKLHSYAGRPAWDQVLREELSGPITTLRAQLAEARAENEKRGREVNVARYGQPDFAWSIHKEALADEAARADRAEQLVANLEAALAAQIEVDAEIVQFRHDENEIMRNTWATPKLTSLDDVADEIRNQPHDRTALERRDAKTREKALREAAAICKADFDCKKLLGVGVEPLHEAILALIEKPNAR